MNRNKSPNSTLELVYKSISKADIRGRRGRSAHSEEIQWTPGLPLCPPRVTEEISQVNLPYLNYIFNRAPGVNGAPGTPEID